MDKWVVEVKRGETFNVNLDEGKGLRLLKARFCGEEKGSKDYVYLKATVEDKIFIIGTLSEIRTVQILDLFFDKDTQISHNWRNGSVCFSGYIIDSTSDYGS
ncbi:hypothetical protein LXL04_028887 [Taraxacum kok-saghyz]